MLLCLSHIFFSVLKHFIFSYRLLPFKNKMPIPQFEKFQITMQRYLEILKRGEKHHRRLLISIQCYFCWEGHLFTLSMEPFPNWRDFYWSNATFLIMSSGKRSKICFKHVSRLWSVPQSKLDSQTFTEERK